MSTLGAMADTIHIVPGNNALYTAVNQSKAHDVIVLSDGQYAEANKIAISHPLTICAAPSATPMLQMKSRIEISAALCLQGVSLEAMGAAEAIRMVPAPNLYSLRLRSSTLKGFSSRWRQPEGGNRSPGGPGFWLGVVTWLVEF